MVPFLDPGCRFFEEPEQHGYRIFHRTLEEHRQAMVEPLWHRRLNYETHWLDRRQLQDVSYEAIARLVEIKGEFGVLPSEFCEAILGTIEETRQLLGEMERALLLDGTLPAALRDEIRSYNRKILAYSSDQIIPVRRPFGGRWFDDVTVPQQMIEENSASGSPCHRERGSREGPADAVTRGGDLPLIRGRAGHGTPRRLLRSSAQLPAAAKESRWTSTGSASFPPLMT